MDFCVGRLAEGGPDKFRADYLGYQFWSPVYDVPETLSDIFTIPHQEVAVTVDGFYLTQEPIQGVKVYLFTASGAYVGISGTTDASGKVRFSLPDRQTTMGTLVRTMHYSWQARYKPFGEAQVQSSSTVVNNFRFPGQYYDQETGLHYNYHRYYDPKMGRYLTPDPIGLARGVNPFVYVQDNPTKRVDPFGLKEFPDDFVGPLPPDGYYTSEMIQTKCGRVPPGPPGADIIKNMQEADASWDPFWFYNQVRNKGPWDYKQKGSKSQDFGNFNYGATGSAFGFPDSILYRGAGWANQKADPTRQNLGSPWGRYPYGDDPDDQEQIRKGIEYCECMGY